jgi:transcription elongation factor Elf1
MQDMTPEEAIQKMFATREPETVVCPKCGEQTVTEAGLIDDEGNVRCPICGLIATYK